MSLGATVRFHMKPDRLSAFNCEPGRVASERSPPPAEEGQPVGRSVGQHAPRMFGQAPPRARELQQPSSRARVDEPHLPTTTHNTPPGPRVSLPLAYPGRA